MEFTVNRLSGKEWGYSIGEQSIQVSNRAYERLQSKLELEGGTVAQGYSINRAKDTESINLETRRGTVAQGGTVSIASWWRH